MKFRRRIRVFPGFSLNLSSSGVSATVGPRGANINFSKRGTYLNTSVPGTGLYDRYKIGGSKRSPYSAIMWNDISPTSAYVDLLDTSIVEEHIIGEIKSKSTSEISSSSLSELKKTLNEAYIEKKELPLEIELAKKALNKRKRNLILLRVLIIGFFIKSLNEKVDEAQFDLDCLRDQFSTTHVDIDIHLDKEYQLKYDNVVNAFNKLLQSQKIWDVTASISIDRVKTRSAASQEVTTVPVKFAYNNIDIIKSSYQAFHFENKNGGDLYIYPTFVIMTNDLKEFGLVDLKEFELDFGERRLLTEEEIPSEAEIVGHRWAKTNKDGSRDKRFVDNYQIPIAKYGGLYISSTTGLNEEYMVSNHDYAMNFERAFAEYKQVVVGKF